MTPKEAAAKCRENVAHLKSVIGHSDLRAGDSRFHYYEGKMDGYTEAEELINQISIPTRKPWRWHEWPSDDNEADYPPDSTDVLIYCGKWASRDMVIGRINKRSGTYGPSGASHWAFLPPAPEVQG